MTIGGLEAGGTKMVCAIGDEQGKIMEKKIIPTGTPEDTMPQLIDFYKGKGIEALGIGCFGPVDLNGKSDTYGYIRQTTKLPWINYDIVGNMKKELQIPIGFDTDVNGAILGEATWGAAKGLDNAIYITIGTGIGVGVYIGKKLVHGLMHPEAGHVLLNRHPRDHYKGHCPYHSNCAEGLAAGPAVEERWGRKAVELADREEVWEMEAYYISQAIADYIFVYSPEKIILGGGIMHQKQLYDKIRKKTVELLNGYIARDEILGGMENYIVEPFLGDEAGIKGALCLGYAVL